ncbi:hypothetical protein EVAR_30406_1 [Eumeta japonica]|uniref:Uncharacterized protein n=1 Tax=Eumeta variegata TaxID=151549 RepID=A0A4C1W417_EUMVA|nr:hypothetical protein EVAR_30406_1 [Eumeta japonica]
MWYEFNTTKFLDLIPRNFRRVWSTVMTLLEHLFSVHRVFLQQILIRWYVWKCICEERSAVSVRPWNARGWCWPRCWRRTRRATAARKILVKSISPSFSSQQVSSFGCDWRSRITPHGSESTNDSCAHPRELRRQISTTYNGMLSKIAVFICESALPLAVMEFIIRREVIITINRRSSTSTAPGTYFTRASSFLYYPWLFGRISGVSPHRTLSPSRKGKKKGRFKNKPADCSTSSPSSLQATLFRLNKNPTYCHVICSRGRYETAGDGAIIISNRNAAAVIRQNYRKSDSPTMAAIRNGNPTWRPAGQEFSERNKEARTSHVRFIWAPLVRWLRSASPAFAFTPAFGDAGAEHALRKIKPERTSIEFRCRKTLPAFITHGA